MSKTTLADGRMICEYARPYFIAEVNSSHNGSTEVAKRMIDAARDAGFDCVKFQSWSAATLYSKNYYKTNPIAKRFVQKFSLSPKELKEMADYCREHGIGFSSTPYSRDEVDFLINECKVPFIKISSMEVNNTEYLDYIARKHVPVVISTGMAEIEEVERAVEILENAKNRDIIILHCVSLYPTLPEQVNLNNIIGLRERFPNYPIGFSDHTIGDTCAIAATALGVAAIEKHITLDATKIGMDNQMAMEPDDLVKLVRRCTDASTALGVKERIIHEEERKQRSNMRRSVVATKDLHAGHVLRKEDLDVKRPGTGIPPDKLNELIGKTINRDIEADFIIMPDDIVGGDKQ